MSTGHFSGTWRSYKTFFFRGEVKHHEESSYREMAITDDGELILKECSTFTKKKVLVKDDWEIRKDGNRCFLYLEKKKAFEMITLEKTELVLLDPVTGEKTFYAALPLWQERLQRKTATDKNVYINLWSKSLIKLITIEK